MHIDALLRMANQIGDFFEAMPDRDEALEGIAMHLKRFWEPRMRRELLAHIDAAGSPELHAVVAQAITRHRTLLN
jgi:formate dehydrogenase subunit delta